MYISKFDLEKTVDHAAMQAWLLLEKGTDLPWVFVKGRIEDERLSLHVIEGKSQSRKTPADPGEIARFKAGPPRWEQSVDEWLADCPEGYYGDMSERQIWEWVLSDDPGNCEPEARIIMEGLSSPVGDWLARHGVVIQQEPGELLRQLVEKRDTIPAAMLAHAYLPHWKCEPLKDASVIFQLCDLLGASLNRQEYRCLARRCLRALSKSLNEEVDVTGFYHGEIMAIHRQLFNRSDRSYPNFKHKANLAVVLKLL
jgi:hypothetical protein